MDMLLEVTNLPQLEMSKVVKAQRLHGPTKISSPNVGILTVIVERNRVQMVHAVLHRRIA
jgi:predicted ATP-dependent serine protease